MTASDLSIGDLLISKTNMPARRARVPEKSRPKKPVSVVLMPLALALAARGLPNARLQPRSHYSARRSSAAVMARCSSRRPPSSREGQEHRAGSSAEPERYCDYRNSRTRSRSQQDGRRGGTRGSGSDRARRTPGRDPRGTRGAFPGHHDYQRAENGGCSEPEISEVVAGVDGPHEPEDHWRRGKERRTE